MNTENLNKLKEDNSKLISLINELKRAKNDSQRKIVNPKIESLKLSMIDNFELRSYDKHIFHYHLDNDYFLNDTADIIRSLEENE